MIQHIGWLPPVTGARPPDWGVAGFNLLLVNTAGALTALLAEAYRRSRRELIAVNQELERAHGRIVETERLRAMGELASGVAHHLNNLLAVILGRVQLALGRSPTPEIARHLTIAERATRDGAEVIRRMRGLGHEPAPAQLETIDLNALAGEIVELTRPRCEDEAHVRGITIATRLEAGEAPPGPGAGPPLRDVVMHP